MIELVYFVFPKCDGNCAHCWSSDTKLGTYKDLNHHKKLIDALKKENYEYSQIKLSGGEPFYNKDVGKIAEYIHYKLGSNIPINVFTSGRPFVSLKEGAAGITETEENLKKFFKDFANISIQLSVDEFHLKVLCEKYHWGRNQKKKLFRNYITNFVEACLRIKKSQPLFLGPKLKIHCQNGRIRYHVSYLFDWMPKFWWEEYCCLTEGLVCSGNAKTLKNTFKINESDKTSVFLLPFVDFYSQPVTNDFQIYDVNSKKLYLDESNHSAILIEGWWNLIDRKAIYRKILVD